MSNFENLKTGYIQTHITKQDLYDCVLKGYISVNEYKEICGEEIQELPLDILKKNKKDELWDACNFSILDGFYFDYNGERYLIGLDEMDQSNLTQILALIDSIPEPIIWKTKGQLIFLPLTKEEFIQMALVAKSHKEGFMQTYFYMCSLIESATDAETLGLIMW